MFIIEIPYFDLNDIYNSGQAPRWIKLKDSRYIIPFRDKAVKAEQQKDKYDLNRCRLFLNCPEEDFFKIWFEYFDIRTDYYELNRKVKKLGGKFKVPANRGSGIHILRQETFEMYIFSKLVTYAGYKEARKIINHIAQVCGIEHTQSMREAGRITWYEFPTPEMILQNLDKLKNMGKVNPWLKKVCEAILDNELDITQSKNKLFRLLGMREDDVFPINEIEDTLVKNFGGNPEEFANWYLYDIENKGIVYMYIVHHKLNPPIKMGEVILRGFGR